MSETNSFMDVPHSILRMLIAEGKQCFHLACLHPYSIVSNGDSERVSQLPCPNPDGSDLILPLPNTMKNCIFDNRLEHYLKDHVVLKLYGHHNRERDFFRSNRIFWIST